MDTVIVSLPVNLIMKNNTPPTPMNLMKQWYLENSNSGPEDVVEVFAITATLWVARDHLDTGAGPTPVHPHAKLTPEQVHP